MSTKPTPDTDPYLDKLDTSLSVSIDSHKISSQEFDKQVVYIAGGALALTIGKQQYRLLDLLKILLLLPQRKRSND
jgi:hypothetical protein